MCCVNNRTSDKNIGLVKTGVIKNWTVLHLHCIEIDPELFRLSRTNDIMKVTNFKIMAKSFRDEILKCHQSGIQQSCKNMADNQNWRFESF